MSGRSKLNYMINITEFKSYDTKSLSRLVMQRHKRDFSYFVSLGLVLDYLTKGGCGRENILCTGGMILSNGHMMIYSGLTILLYLRRITVMQFLLLNLVVMKLHMVCFFAFSRIMVTYNFIMCVRSEM